MKRTLAASTIALATLAAVGGLSPALAAEQRRQMQVSGAEQDEMRSYVIGDVRFMKIGASSVWILNNQHDEYAAGKALSMPYFLITGTITATDVDVIRKLLKPVLDPSYFKDKSRTKPTWYDASSDKITFKVTVRSTGGNVSAAIAIGRLLRQARAEVSVPEDRNCFSACVFLLAGAVDRKIGQKSRVGIHRPYSADTKDVGYDEMQRRQTSINRLASGYLSDMNMPPELYAAMTRVPPTEIRLLNDGELDQYGLNRPDPVFEELQLNAEARTYGLPKGEYLARKVLRDRCVLERMASSAVFAAQEMTFEQMIELKRIETACNLAYMIK